MAREALKSRGGPSAADFIPLVASKLGNTGTEQGFHITTSEVLQCVDTDCHTSAADGAVTCYPLVLPRSPSSDSLPLLELIKANQTRVTRRTCSECNSEAILVGLQN